MQKKSDQTKQTGKKNFFFVCDMHANDDGFFHYDTEFPPLNVEPPTWQQAIFRDCMRQGVILAYLQESHKFGVKDSNTVLPCGLTAGEAAVLYFRTTNKKHNSTGPVKPVKTADNEYVQRTVTGLRVHMGIDVSKEPLQTLFACHFNSQLFDSRHWKKNFQTTLKTFLGAANLRIKGYTSKLKIVVEDVLRP
jgi:hypothetical protein